MYDLVLLDDLKSYRHRLDNIYEKYEELETEINKKKNVQKSLT